MIFFPHRNTQNIASECEYIYISFFQIGQSVKQILKRREIGFPGYGKPTFIHDSQEITLVCDV